MKDISAVLIILIIGIVIGYFGYDKFNEPLEVYHVDSVLVSTVDTLYLESDIDTLYVQGDTDTLYVPNEPMVLSSMLDTTFTDGGWLKVKHTFVPFNRWELYRQAPPIETIIEFQVKTIYIEIEKRWYEKPYYTIPIGIVGGYWLGRQ